MFEIPTNWSESYGTRLRGYLHPPATGNYTFYIASDDASELWLSTDEDPASAVLICASRYHAVSPNHSTAKNSPVSSQVSRRGEISPSHRSCCFAVCGWAKSSVSHCATLTSTKTRFEFAARVTKIEFSPLLRRFARASAATYATNDPIPPTTLSSWSSKDVTAAVR